MMWNLCSERFDCARTVSRTLSRCVYSFAVFVCNPEFLIDSSECLVSTSIFNTFLALFQTVVQPNVLHGSEIVLHPRQRVVVADPMLQCVSRVNVCSSLP